LRLDDEFPVASVAKIGIQKFRAATPEPALANAKLLG
jgi:hypothetical protein